MPAALGGPRAIPANAHRPWPAITDEDRAAVAGVMARGVLSGPAAPESCALQEEFAALVGARHCLVTASGTAALHMALAAAGVRAGDEVIVPAFTFVASALAVLHQGAIPVFVDVDPRTWTLDPERLHEVMSDRTRAVMPVHLHGCPADMDSILAFADQHGLVVVEDACQAHLADWRGRAVGTLGAAGAFSLQSSKNLAAGEGGLFVTNSDEVAAAADRMRNFGEDIPTSAVAFDPRRPLDSARPYETSGMGHMYRGQELTAALARSRLRRLANDTARAQRNAAILTAAIDALPGVAAQHVLASARSVWHKFRVVVDAHAAAVVELLPPRPSAFRDLVAGALCEEGVEAVAWQSKPLPAHALFQRLDGFGRGYPWSLIPNAKARYGELYRIERFPVTTDILNRSFCLFSQSNPLIAQDEALVERYAAALRKVWAHLPALAGR